MEYCNSAHGNVDTASMSSKTKYLYYRMLLPGKHGYSTLSNIGSYPYLQPGIKVFSGSLMVQPGRTFLIQEPGIPVQQN